MTVFHTSGLKETGPRRRVLEALRAAHEPLTAQEIAARAGTSLASTYRVLALLVELGIAGEITDASPGSAMGSEHGSAEARSRRYALCSAVGHHHHFICRSCRHLADIASPALERALSRAAVELEAEYGVRTEEHELTLWGLCAACSQSSHSRQSNQEEM